MRDFYGDIESSLLTLRILANRAHYVMQDVEEDYFHNADWYTDKSKWACLAHMFPRTASKSCAVADAIIDLRRELDEIESAVNKHFPSANAISTATDPSSPEYIRQITRMLRRSDPRVVKLSYEFVLNLADAKPEGGAQA